MADFFEDQNNMDEDDEDISLGWLGSSPPKKHKSQVEMDLHSHKHNRGIEKKEEH